jgi:hypothetical protein
MFTQVKTVTVFGLLALYAQELHQSRFVHFVLLPRLVTGVQFAVL